MVKAGIVGLPNVGKSTLFNALLKKRVALSANYPFTTIEPNTGVVAVPDERLEELAQIVKNEEKLASLPPIIPAVVEFVDIAGLVKGASTGVGLGNQFLSHIREVDAIIHVLRDFDDPNIIREGSISPQEDRNIIETELALSDIQVLEKLIPNQEREIRASKDSLEQEKLNILNQIKSELDQGHIIANYHIGDDRLHSWFGTLPLLTIKPILYVYNVSEAHYKNQLDRALNPSEIIISAKLEEDLVDLSEADRSEYLSQSGIKQTGLERLIKKAYDLLGLISFLTAGEKEVRAWTIKKSTRAPQTAGVIHSDFEKNFIRAQVITYDKLLEAGSYKQAREKGLIRTEGKDYIVSDGDVIEFLVSK